MIYRTVIISSILLSLIYISCGKDSKPLPADGSMITLSDAEDRTELTAGTQFWHQTDECICVLFGYGYNDRKFVGEMQEKLFRKFGSYSDGGHIFPLVFPDDFKRGSKTYITNIENELSDKNVRGLVLLGAPENTYKAIARMQDEWGDSLPYPVFSLFSQDDVLAMEDSADFVLDKAQKAEINGIIPEEEQTYIQEVPSILMKSVKYALLSDSALEKNARLFDFVKMIAGNTNIARYTDTETNLTSINHFIIE